MTCLCTRTKQFFKTLTRTRRVFPLLSPHNILLMHEVATLGWTKHLFVIKLPNFNYLKNPRKTCSLLDSYLHLLYYCILEEQT